MVGSNDIEALEPWLAGLPLKERRPFTDDERDEIRALRAKAGFIGCGALILLLGLPVLAITSMVFFEGSNRTVLWLPILLSPLALLGVAWLVPFTLLTRALKNGHMMMFEGKKRNLRGFDASLNLLSKTRLLPSDGTSFQIKLLDGPTRVWSIDAQRPTLYQLCVPYKLARVAPATGVQERQLTEFERAELKAHIDRYRGASVPLMAGILLVIVAVQATFFAFGKYDGIMHSLAITMLVGAQLTLAVRGRPLAELLAKDLEHGRLLCGEQSGSLKLPISGFPWSRHDVPSVWRTAARPDHATTVPDAGSGDD
jgi:hypothetical protein